MWILKVMRQRVLVALVGFVIVFTILSPLMGNLVHRLMRRYFPTDSALAVMATALIIFLLSFAIVVGVLLRFGPAGEIGLGTTLLIGLISALLVTAVTAWLVGRGLKRASQKITSEDYAFKVWDEDARERRKNLRRR